MKDMYSFVLPNVVNRWSRQSSGSCKCYYTISGILIQCMETDTLIIWVFVLFTATWYPAPLLWRIYIRQDYFVHNLTLYDLVCATLDIFLNITIIQRVHFLWIDEVHIRHFAICETIHVDRKRYSVSKMRKLHFLIFSTTYQFLTIHFYVIMLPNDVIYLSYMCLHVVDTYMRHKKI